MSLASIQPFLILPLVYFTRGIDFSPGSSNLLWLRTAFGAVQVLTAVALLLIRQRIEAAKATTSAKEIKVKAPKQPFATEEPEEKTSTVYLYDTEQLNSLIKGTVIQLCILGFIHYKWAAAVPLVTQLLLGPLKIYTNELFQSYVLGAELERPFPPPPSPFGDLMKNLSGEPEKKEKKPKAKPIAAGETKKQK